MKPEAQIGDTLVFSESGDYALVKVADVREYDSLWEYDLEAIKILLTFAGAPRGFPNSFTVSKHKEFGHMVGWYLWKLDHPYILDKFGKLL